MQDPGQPDMTKLRELVEAEYGSDWTPHLNGYTAVINATLAGGCFQPGWIALAMEVGMQAALRDPEFARKLVGGLGYGRQLIGGQENTEIVENLVEVLLSGKTNHNFGREV